MVWGLLTRTLNCIVQHDPKFKSLGLFDSLSKKRAGAQMIIEEITVLGFVFAATTLAAIAYERRMDVLYGPYLEGRANRMDFSAGQFWKPINSAVDHFRWKARNMLYLTSVIAC
jgi:hypothetical protein